MQLIGMLDSPYVRRVAVSLQLLGLAFEHRPLSVFRTYDQFREINPLVRAPSLVCDDGIVLMDSTLILEYAERLPAAKRALMPPCLSKRQHALRIIGLALAACEKSVQLIYECNLRPPEKQHPPWITRVTEQLLAAYCALESELAGESLPIEPIDQGHVTTAVAWHFTQMMLPEVVPASRFPALQELSASAERLPEFAAAPHGSGTYHCD